MTTVLHEILAVEGDREGNAKRLMVEAQQTFENKPNLFTGSLKSTRMFDENSPVVPDEHVSMVTTVGEKLDYLAKAVGSYFNVVFQKDEANQRAMADVVVNGNIIVKDAPVTWLLGMETKLRDLRKVLERIPTLQPGVYWEPDPGHEKANVFRTKHPVSRFKTMKVPMHKVLYEATDRHPAQIETWNEMANIGEITETTWTGMVSPADKAAILGRMDQLIQGVKKARQRANATEVKPSDVGEKIFDFLIG
jgi:hypothetical protein